ncbi:MAG: sensor histidine kinase [Pseudonocardiaceae bacterium]|nr:sensor histidine kinase [Pseudonocardiaceae bacterium]
MNMSGDRRTSRGRRNADHGADALRGALHDVGHDLATLGYLIEAVRGDTSLSSPARARVELVERELSRLVEIIRGAISQDATPAMINVRPLIQQLVSVHTLVGGAEIVFVARADLKLHVDSTILWRILSNLVQNALRAAGPTGRVELALHDHPTPVIAISDNGPGFGAAPGGWGTIGLGVVDRLARVCGAQLRFEDREPHGTRVELAFSEQPTRATAGIEGTSS